MRLIYIRRKCISSQKNHTDFIKYGQQYFNAVFAFGAWFNGNMQLFNYFLLKYYENIS